MERIELCCQSCQWKKRLIAWKISVQNSNIFFTWSRLLISQLKEKSFCFFFCHYERDLHWSILKSKLVSQRKRGKSAINLMSDLKFKLGIVLIFNKILKIKKKLIFRISFYNEGKSPHVSEEFLVKKETTLRFILFILNFTLKLELIYHDTDLEIFFRLYIVIIAR